MSRPFSIPSFDLSGVMAQFFDLVNNYDAQKTAKTNLVDPFAASLEAALYQMKTERQWKISEAQRTRQKNLMNHLGLLQQGIIGQLPGWQSFSSGQDMPDVVGKRGKQRFLCEIKNKHNTMNKNSTAETYDVMASFLSQSRFSDYTGVLVQMIARTPRRFFWKPFAPKGRVLREDMIIMNARVFYAFATDPEKRVPGVDVQPTEDLRKWESWTALDFMLEEFWAELERQTHFITPKWIREIAEQTL